MPFHVLIVENARGQRRILRGEFQALEQKFELADVASGEEALLLLARQPVALLVTGYKLAGISGVELMRKARQRRPGLKVILLAGKDDLSAASRAGAAEADFLLSRPVEHIEFLDAVQHCLGLPGSTRLPVVMENGPVPQPVKPPAEMGLPTRLADLRQELSAHAVLILDVGGQIVSQAGALPRSELAAALLPAAALAINAASQVSLALGAGSPSGLQVVSGVGYDAILAPLGSGLALLAVLPGAPGGRNFERAARLLPPAVDGMLDLLPKPVPANDLKPSAAEEKAAPKIEPAAHAQPAAETDPALEKIFKQAPKKIKTAELDDFWDTLASQADSGNDATTGEISYEQARRMGLAPGEGKP